MKKIFLLCAVLLLAACDNQADDTAADATRPTMVPTMVDVPAVAAPDAALPLQTPAPAQVEEEANPVKSLDGLPGYVGRWTGPEGTYMDILDKPTHYEITIRDLDAAKNYVGQAEGEVIAFTRDGVRETIIRGDGVATGMKWLADKKNCLVIKPGEGYCRD